MDNLNARLKNAASALSALEEALQLESPSPLERDGAIQRFEFSFEAFWKASRAWLEQNEGIPCSSPRGCLRALGQVGVLDTAETTASLAMADDRNLTVHTYHEETAQAIFQRLPAHAGLMRQALDTMTRRIES